MKLVWVLMKSVIIVDVLIHKANLSTQPFFEPVFVGHGVWQMSFS